MKMRLFLGNADLVAMFQRKKRFSGRPWWLAHLLISHSFVSPACGGNRKWHEVAVGIIILRRKHCHSLRHTEIWYMYGILSDNA